MLKNYLKIAIRNLRRNAGYSAINIGGLAVGITCVLLILAFVQDERSFDRFHADADRIYRVHVGQDQEVTPTIVAPLMQRSLAEVKAATRLYDIGRFQPPVVSRGEVQFLEPGFFYADSTVFSVFTLPLVQGAPGEALRRPNTIVLSASTARKYFGDADPIGETVLVGGSRSFEVTGVMEDLPAQSHVQFDMLASFVTTGWSDEEIWNSANFYTYLKLGENASAAGVSQKMAGLVEAAHAENRVRADYSLSLQPLTGIRLDFEGRRVYVYLLTAIALLILLIACVNYINLATARGAKRAREVGVRKVSGAQRGQLIKQFLGESFLTALLAMVLAVVLTTFLLPYFNALTGKAITFYNWTNPALWGGLGVLFAFVGLAGGAYPAFLLSGYQPLHIFKTTMRSGTGSNRLRRGLVVFQFAVSVVLMVGTVVIYRQLDFIQSKDLGFEKERLLVLPVGLGNDAEEYAALRADLMGESAVLQVSAINHIPGYQQGGYGFWAEGVFEDPETLPPIGGVPAEAHVVDVLGLELVAGSKFLPTHADSIQRGNFQYLLNESAVRRAGWSPEEAVGKRIALSGNRLGTVVGVIGDYHYLSLHEKIEPLAYFYEPWGCNYVLVKLQPGASAATLDRIEAVWSTWLPDRPFFYSFLDDEIGLLYRADQQAGQVFLMAALLAVLIACFGLLGLAAFTASQRRKEVGIRKAMGASVTQVVLLLTREFSLLVFIGFCLAVPVAFLVMRGWLQNFAYRITLSPLLFLAAGFIVLLIAWLTVSYQALRAARINPVDALRYE